MAYRVNAINAASGRALAPYDSDAGSVADVFAEAKRRGVHIVSLLPLGKLRRDVDADEILAAGAPELGWRMNAWSLIQLGKELPGAADAMVSTLGTLTGLVVAKPVLFGLVAIAGAVLAAFGVDAEFERLLLVAFPFVVLLPLLASKLAFLPALREAYDPGGRSGEQWLRAGEREMIHFDGRAPRTLVIEGIDEILELPRFLYFRWQQGWTLAVPKCAFANEESARAFAQRLAGLAKVEPTWNVRSAWVGQFDTERDAFVAKLATWFAVLFFGGLWVAAMVLLP